MFHEVSLNRGLDHILFHVEQSAVVHAKGRCMTLGSFQEIQAVCSSMHTRLLFVPLPPWGKDGTRVFADVSLSLRMKAAPMEPPPPCSSVCVMGLLGLFIDEQLGAHHPASD